MAGAKSAAWFIFQSTSENHGEAQMAHMAGKIPDSKLLLAMQTECSNSQRARESHFRKSTSVWSGCTKRLTGSRRRSGLRSSCAVPPATIRRNWLP